MRQQVNCRLPAISRALRAVGGRRPHPAAPYNPSCYHEFHRLPPQLEPDEMSPDTTFIQFTSNECVNRPLRPTTRVAVSHATARELDPPPMTISFCRIRVQMVISIYAVSCDDPGNGRHSVAPPVQSCT